MSSCPPVRAGGTVRGLMDVHGGRHVKDVLVVDDERSLRLLCRVNLELEGHTVREAATARRGTAGARAGDAGRRPARHPCRRRRRAGAPRRDRRARAADARGAALGDERGRPGAARARRLRAREALRAAAALSRRLRRPTAPVGSPDVSVTGVRTPVEYEERLARYLFERSEEGRAVRVGEKETSEQAAIVERYRDLFSPGQLEVLREAENAAEGERARAPLPPAQDMRGGDRLGGAGGARGRAREPDPGRPGRLARRGAAAADRAGEARRAAGLRRPGRAGLARERGQRRLQRRPPRAARSR